MQDLIRFNPPTFVTNSATPTLAVAVPLELNTLVGVVVTVTASAEDGSQKTWLISASARRLSGDGELVDYAIAATVETGDTEDWDLAVLVSSNHLRVRVMGVAATEIAWSADVLANLFSLT